MKIEISKAWCLNMARLEGNAEIGAGLLAVDPTSHKAPIANPAASNVSHIAFGRLIRLMRRKEGLTIENLADKVDIDVDEIVSIEDNIHHNADPRTVYQLANHFKLPKAELLQLAGLAAPKNDALFNEAVRFAARSDPTARLSPEEQAALEAFVAVLSKNK